MTYNKDNFTKRPIESAAFITATIIKILTIFFKSKAIIAVDAKVIIYSVHSIVFLRPM